MDLGVTDLGAHRVRPAADHSAVTGASVPWAVSPQRIEAKDRVKLIQRELKTLGYNVGPVDGIFGPKTDAAVKAVQTDQALTVDGIVGPITWKALFN